MALKVISVLLLVVIVLLVLVLLYPKKPKAPQVKPKRRPKESSTPSVPSREAQDSFHEANRRLLQQASDSVRQSLDQINRDLERTRNQIHEIATVRTTTSRSAHTHVLTGEEAANFLRQSNLFQPLQQLAGFEIVRVPTKSAPTAVPSKVQPSTTPVRSKWQRLKDE